MSKSFDPARDWQTFDDFQDFVSQLKHKSKSVNDLKLSETNANEAESSSPKLQSSKLADSSRCRGPRINQSSLSRLRAEVEKNARQRARVSGSEYPSDNPSERKSEPTKVEKFFAAINPHIQQSTFDRPKPVLGRLNKMCNTKKTKIQKSFPWKLRQQIIEISSEHLHTPSDIVCPKKVSVEVSVGKPKPKVIQELEDGEVLDSDEDDHTQAVC